MDRERRLAGHTVLIEDGRITALARQGRVAIPEGATLIDGTGRYLIPGLAEMHAHIPSSREGVEAMERVLFLYAANGVTTARGMLGDPAHLRSEEHTSELQSRGQLV